MGERFDFVVVGGGIVGLAVARRMQEAVPGARVLLVEKEDAVALHQTGRNSGVIHAGVYYKPGSLKAQFSRAGVVATRAYCDAHGIETQICGKLIVAVDEAEAARLAALKANAEANGIVIEALSGAEARAMEPAIRAEAALLSPTTGIVDFAAMARHMAAQFVAAGGELRTSVRVTGGREAAGGVVLVTTAGEIAAGKAVFCAGLMADRMARAFGAEVDFRIIPFRGEYFRILNQPADLVRHLIYPVPDPERPFLGVHLTRKLDGGFTVGPNAVLAGAREGYGKTSLSLRDMAEVLAYPGFWRLISKHARSAVGELSASAVKRLYLAKVQRYCPQVGLGDLAPYKAGIRAQAVARDGRMIDDFLFVETRHSLHVCNAPSPAATSALPIAAHIVERVLAAG
jgi:(S)-2-hydroxyglutarate dehydrogenase